VLRRFTEDADVCVYVDGRYFALHRVVLASRSEFFRTMWSSGFMESLTAAGPKRVHGSGSGNSTTLPTLEVRNYL
jgi:hypothetical protein